MSRTRDASGANEQQRGADVVAGDVRARAWELHLRGVAKTRIAGELGVHRDTIGRWVRDMYAEVGADRKAAMARKLDGAVARLRRIQEQAWADHDADDARELRALDFSMSGGEESEGRTSVRFQSQRSQYLRIAMDAEREIARLWGLYEGLLSEEARVTFRLVQVTDDGANAQIAATDAHRGILPPQGGFAESVEVEGEE